MDQGFLLKMFLRQCVVACSTFFPEYAAPSDLHGGCRPVVVVYLCEKLTDKDYCEIFLFQSFTLLRNFVLKHTSRKWISWLWRGSQCELYHLKPVSCKVLLSSRA